MSELVVVVNDHGNCPSCGQGRGKPHFERCAIQPPEYGRYMTKHEIQALVTYAIAIFPLDVVRRSTIRAMLPRGRTKGHPTAEQRKANPNASSVNILSLAFQARLKSLDDHGWIERRDDCVVILQRARLLRSAQRQLAESPDLVIALHASLAGVASGLPAEITPAGRAQRASELRALKKLMEESPATGPHGGRGYVKLVNKPRMVP